MPRGLDGKNQISTQKVKGQDQGHEKGQYYLFCLTRQTIVADTSNNDFRKVQPIFG